MEFLIQAAGLFLLLGGMWFGYQQWVRPYDATLTLPARGLLILMVATLMGGFIGSPFWWADQEWSFSWDLPPLASRMLGAAGWSFFVVTLLALRRPTYRRLRLILLLLFVYLVPLTIVILLFHLDRFDFRAPITYGFFAIVIPMDIAATAYLLRQPQIIPDATRDTLPSAMVIQVWLLIVATITALWGLALLVTDSGPLRFIWAWSGDLLTSRLIAVMLLTITFGALYAFRYAATARMMLGMIGVYSLGLTVAAVWNSLYDLPIQPLYTAVFGIILIVTSIMLKCDHQPTKIPTHIASKLS